MRFFFFFPQQFSLRLERHEDSGELIALKAAAGMCNKGSVGVFYDN